MAAPADILTQALTALGLSMDCATVAAAQGLAAGRMRWRALIRLTGAFGLFQAALYLVGGSVGSGFREALGSWGHWIAFLLLAGIGGKMLRDASEEGREVPPEPDLAAVSLLALATSLDALAVGLGQSMQGGDLLRPALWIGAVSALVPGLAYAAASRLGRGLGRWAERAGGLVLIGIGLESLVSGLQGGA